MPSSPPVKTARLDLVRGTVEILHAELAGRVPLERALGVVVPGEWPPELFDEPAVRWTLDRIENERDWLEWGFLYFVLRDLAGGPGVLVGAGGYKGPPTSSGAVEVGYSILSQFRRRGLATEATLGMVAHAFTDPRVQYIVAQTLPELIPSIGVLVKAGFHFAGPGDEEGVVRYELARTSGPASLPSSSEEAGASEDQSG